MCLDLQELQDPGKEDYCTVVFPESECVLDEDTPQWAEQAGVKNQAGKQIRQRKPKRGRQRIFKPVVRQGIRQAAEKLR